MRKVNIACIQMKCSDERDTNIQNALVKVSEAAEKGANIILLPELFERNYFCQERRYDYYAFAERTEDNAAVKALLPLSKKRQAVIPVSFYEKCGNVLYNSVAVLDCGKILGVYRKTHIPDDHYYQEKFYFTPGHTGFQVFDTMYGKIGAGICWDQWFPETARCLALKGAELLFFPTAIGSEPVLGCDSMPHWRRVMQGHAGANLMPVIAANRIGTEAVSPCEENGGQESALTFYGSSFMTDETGALVKDASRDKEEILLYTYDLKEIEKNRLSWGLFRDRRPELYGKIGEV